MQDIGTQALLNDLKQYYLLLINKLVQLGLGLVLLLGCYFLAELSTFAVAILSGTGIAGLIIGYDDDLTSDDSDIRQQANAARNPEQGNNIL